MPSSHIIPSGGLFTHHFLEAIQQPSFSHPAASPDSFTLPGESPPSPSELENRIASAWELLTERWDSIENRISGIDISTLRDRWLLPLFSLLDFGLDYQRADLVLDDDLRFPISHLGRASWDISRYFIPVHTVLPAGADGLDAHPKQGGRGLKSLAHHDMLQRFLNFSPKYKWGILSDGLRLRILRDYHHTYTRGYVEFDLQGIFSTRDFAAFRALYRLAYASRFIPPSPEVGRGDGGEGEELEPPIEKFYQHALSTGIKVGEDLRKNVQDAIETLANGFLRATPGLLSSLQIDEGEIHYFEFGDLKPVDAFFHDILTTIYRILFLLFAEQRGMLPGRGSLYIEEFSLTALRARAERPLGEDPNLDLWERLKTTFKMVEKGAPELDVFGYNGALFHGSRTPLLMTNDSPLPELEEGLGARADSQCRNDSLLQAIRYLTTIERESVRQRISYADLSVEEIGSIYEGLLEFTPRVTKTAEQVNGRDITPATFFLDPRGATRKTTGSYYTHPSLVNELIKSALIPVMEDRLKEAVPGIDLEHPESLSEEERQKAQKAILSLKVVDPAAGSGAFLIAATNTLGLHLAQIRSGSPYPSERETRTARRDVLAQCIYAVDVNPMAVELCKVSLWINAAVDDAPLSFLDHHIKCGNSLIGATPELLAKGVPDDAFQPVTGDDKDIAKSIRARNKSEREGQLNLFSLNILRDQKDLKQWRDLAILAQSDPKVAERRYGEYLAGADYQHARLVADLWAAAFYWPLKEDSPDPPTTEVIFQAQTDLKIVEQDTIDESQNIAESHRFFHWPLEFPEVFNHYENIGFDVVLSNPPWEKIKLQEKEFFEGRDEKIYHAKNTSERGKLILSLQNENPGLWQEYLEALRKAENISIFIRNSGRYTLTGHGDINTFSIFSECAFTILNKKGRFGLIVPTGIVTDDANKEFFGHLLESEKIVSVLDFQNTNSLFPNVDRNQKFTLLTVRRYSLRERSHTPIYSFGLRSVHDLENPDQVFSMSKQDIIKINPNTKTLPAFKSSRDAVIIKHIYLNCPIFYDDEHEEHNSWRFSFQRMFDMSGDSKLFRTEEQIRNLNFQEVAYVNLKTNQIYFRLFEGKMFQQFDHRFSSAIQGTTGQKLRGTSVYTTVEQHKDPNYYVLPRYWISLDDIRKKNQSQNWFIGFRRVAGSVSNIRTATFSILPLGGFSDSVFLINPSEDKVRSGYLVANFNSFVLDYILRNKLTGMNLNYYIIKQLPVIPLKWYSASARRFLAPKLLELTYTAWDIKSFADDAWRESDQDLRDAFLRQWKDNSIETKNVDSTGSQPNWLLDLNLVSSQDPFPYPPFKWHAERRSYIRADIDGLYAHMYGLHRDELDYILETFPIVRKRDEEKYDEYRTKRLVLDAYDRIASRHDYEELIPLEARARSQESILVKSHTSIREVRPDAPLEKPTKPVDSKSKASKPKEQSDEAIALTQESHVEGNPAANPPSLSDYSLYRCSECEKHVLGFDLDRHTREVHGGLEPGYLKIR